MLHAVQYSLIDYLRSVNALTAVIWHYNGVKLPTNLPFATVENLNTGVVTLAKKRTHTGYEYNFQVGVFANNAGELTKLIDILNDGLAVDLPLIDTSGNIPQLTADNLRTTVLNVTPLPVESEEGLSSYHRAYFDVQAYVIKQN